MTPIKNYISYDKESALNPGLNDGSEKARSELNPAAIMMFNQLVFYYALKTNDLSRPKGVMSKHYSQYFTHL